MSAALKHIRTVIEKNGPLTVGAYMDMVLQHPEFGYYRSGDPIGREGDFVTAPEVSQMFGEMIGLWCADVWRQMGKPEQFTLLELGPGRGTLMQDAMRATARLQDFQKAMTLCLLESNETLQKAQREKLKDHNPQFLNNVDLPDAPVIVVANEFFDALPVRQFEKGFNGWQERKVIVQDEKLAFTLSPLEPIFAQLI
ncbi:MAG TPA: SAM-dependent methyltransferase, partial [Alphaproteobacteria bacterium]|nr:SAM-dependent methyltransferase [Alphaproteobacteria bacterium]